MKDTASTLLFSLTGPIASGKSTIAKSILELDLNLFLSISTTTRLPRDRETEGKDYFFVSPEKFQEKIKNQEFLEYAEFCGNFYGTEKRNIDMAKAENKDLLLDIEVQGVEQLKKSYGQNLVCVFVFPVSFSVMKRRLVARGTDTEMQIADRLKQAEEEVKKLKSKNFSDYLLINNNLDKALSDAKSIIVAERLRLRKDAVIPLGI